MKRVVFVAAVALAAGAALALAFHAAPGSGKGKLLAAAGPAERVLLKVQGLSCGSCEARIREALATTPGIRAVGVNLAAGQVTVEYAAGAADPRNLAQSLTLLGYPARYLASGPGVPSPGTPRGSSSADCGGSCCAGNKAL